MNRKPKAAKKLKGKAKKVLIKKKSIKRAKPIKRKVSPVIFRKAKLLIKKPARKRKPAKTEMQFQQQDFFKAKIKVIGIGGGGGSIVSEIGKSLGKASFVIADTDSRIAKKAKGIKYLLFGQDLTHGLGTGLNPELAKTAAERAEEKITGLFENQDIVILIASLGGGVGSGATEVFAELSKKFNCITFGIFTLPFKFEGKNKHKVAAKYLAELRRMLNVSITIPNERIFKVIDQNTSISQAFSMVNKNLIKSLESLIDLIYNPGIINIDFADLRAILQGKGNLAFLNTAEASGKNTSEKIIQEILHNPLYQNSNFMAEKILFNIAGSNNLSMLEVDKISRAIGEQNPKAKIIFGISKNPEYKNKVKTTLLMTGPSNLKETKQIEVPIVKEEVKMAPVPLKKAKLKQENKKALKLPKKSKKPAVKKPAEEKEEVISVGTAVPVFNNQAPVALNSEKLSIIDTNLNKKTIRRTALDIKKAEELEEKKKTKQEEEWEIPAFLRFKK